MDNLVARTTVSPNFVNEGEFPVHAASLHISELPLSGIIRIQGSTDGAFEEAVESAFGVQAPAPERVSVGADVTLAWAAPTEYLCFSSLANEAQCESKLIGALAGQFATITVMSDSRVAFLVAGKDAAAFVSKGCSIDMHPSSFGVGHAVTTRFAGLPAMLQHREAGEYVLYFDIGYSEFVVKWLIEAAEEFSDPSV